MTAPIIPKKRDVVMEMKPAEGVIMMSPASAPMKAESSDQRRVSWKVRSSQVRAPEEAQRLVTQRARIEEKLRLRVVPASKASQEPWMGARERGLVIAVRGERLVGGGFAWVVFFFFFCVCIDSLFLFYTGQYRYVPK